MSADPIERRIRELERENAEIKHVNKILQEVPGFLRNAERSKNPSALSVHFQKHCGKWTVKLMCRVLCVSVSSYHKYCRNLGKPNKDTVLSAAI